MLFLISGRDGWRGKVKSWEFSNIFKGFVVIESMKLEINISNKVFYSVLVVVVLILTGVFVWAASPTPQGHDWSEISTIPWTQIIGEPSFVDLIAPYIYVSSGRVGIGTNPDVATRFAVDGDILASGADVRAERFVDADNGNWYADPDNQSMMNGISVQSITLGGVYRTSWPTPNIAIYDCALNTCAYGAQCNCNTVNNYVMMGMKVDTSSVTIRCCKLLSDPDYP